MEKERISSNIKQWTINPFEKYQDIISEDDGVLEASSMMSMVLNILICMHPENLDNLYLDKLFQMEIAPSIIADLG